MVVGGGLAICFAGARFASADGSRMPTVRTAAGAVIAMRARVRRVVTISSL